MTDSPKWERWFAWKPVYVDAYRDEEIRNGKFRYLVCMRWVERRFSTDIYDDETGDRQNCWLYRLPQPEATP